MITFQIGGLTDILVYTGLVSFLIWIAAMAVGVACIVFYFKTKRRGFAFVGASVLVYEITPLVSFVSQLTSYGSFSAYVFSEVFGVIVTLIALSLFTLGLYLFKRDFKLKTQLTASPQTQPATSAEI